MKYHNRLLLTSALRGARQKVQLFSRQMLPMMADWTGSAGKSTLPRLPTNGAKAILGPGVAGFCLERYKPRSSPWEYSEA